MNDEKFSYAVETIKKTVPVVDVARRLGIELDRSNRCKCPFHGGTHNNLKLYDGNGGFYCFVCHESGSVIDFARKILDCSYLDAMRWINREFSLRMDLDNRSFYARKRRVERCEKKERRHSFVTQRS